MKKQFEMKRIKKGWMGLGISAGILILSVCNAAAMNETAAVTEKAPVAGKVKKADTDMKRIANLMVRVLSYEHYSQAKFDDTLSPQIFDEYLKRLDFQRVYFLESDIQKFSKHRNNLATCLLKGDLDFPFDAFNLVISRIQEYQAFAKEFLSKEQNLNTDEVYEYDREKSAWPVTPAQMKELWRKKLLNDLISIKLADRAIEEEAKNKPAADKEKETNPVKKMEKTPQERILSRINMIVQHYSTMEPVEVLEIYLSTIASIYDPHSAYMSPRTNEDFDIEMSLSLVGIGAVLTMEDGYVKIVEIIAGGPADKQGELKAEDRISQVAQENEQPVDVVDMPLNKVVRQIRGEENTKVTLTVLPAGSNVPKQITITRAKVELKDSGAKGEIRDIGGKKVGVITLPSFYIDFDAARQGGEYKSATNDIRKIILGFQKEGIDGLIMDLRSNGGGSLREAVELTGLFIPSGPVVQVRDRERTQVQEDDDDGAILYDGPLIVMINRMSASASEIFAAAIRDYNRGLVVGDAKTHGKGTVQFISDLDRYAVFIFGKRFPAGSVKLTNAKFYRINGESTQLKGISADIVFPAFTDVMDLGEDKLDHALPWDHIESAKFQSFQGPFRLTDERRQMLKEASQKRIAANQDFQLLRHNIGEFDRMKKEKTLKLNLDARWNDYQKEKKLQKEQEELYNQKSSRTEKDKKDEKVQDIYLDETLNIMKDLIQCSDVR